MVKTKICPACKADLRDVPHAIVSIRYPPELKEQISATGSLAVVDVELQYADGRQETFAMGPRNWIYNLLRDAALECLDRGFQEEQLWTPKGKELRSLAALLDEIDSNGSSDWRNPPWKRNPDRAKKQAKLLRRLLRLLGFAEPK